MSTATEKDTNTTNLLGKPYNVILFNYDHHDMMEVSAQIIKATHCSAERAVTIMLEAHVTGRAIVFSGTRERCELVEGILAEIRLSTRIEPA